MMLYYPHNITVNIETSGVLAIAITTWTSNLLYNNLTSFIICTSSVHKICKSLIGCTVTGSSVIQIYSFFSWFLCKRKYCSWVLTIIGNHSQYELGSTLPYGRPFLTPYRALRQRNLDLHQTSPLYHGENGIEVWRRYIYICNIYILCPCRVFENWL